MVGEEGCVTSPMYAKETWINSSQTLLTLDKSYI